MLAPSIHFEGLSEEDQGNLHYSEVKMNSGELVTSGGYGWSMVVTGTGLTIQDARDHPTKLATDLPVRR